MVTSPQRFDKLAVLHPFLPNPFLMIVVVRQGCVDRCEAQVWMGVDNLIGRHSVMLVFECELTHLHIGADDYGTAAGVDVFGDGHSSRY